MNTELIEKIEKDFKKFCSGQLCLECRYIPARPKCSLAFTIDYLAEHGYLKERPEKATLSKTETVADNSSAPATLPKWCKAGQWIISKAELKLHKSVGDCSLKQIDEVDSDGHIFFKLLGTIRPRPLPRLQRRRSEETDR